MAQGFTLASQRQLDTYKSDILADNPVGYWAFDYAKAHVDYSVNSNDFNTTVFSSFEEGVTPIDGAVQGSASTAFTGVPDSSDLVSYDTTTIEAWIKHDGSGGRQCIVSCRTVSDVMYELFWNPSGLGSPVIELFPGTSAGSIGLELTGWSGYWNHIVVEIVDFPAITGRILTGSVRSSQGTSSNQEVVEGYLPPVLGTYVFSVGCRSIATDLNFQGLISEVAIYDYGLSSGQINAHYENRLRYLDPIEEIMYAQEGMARKGIYA